MIDRRAKLNQVQPASELCCFHCPEARDQMNNTPDIFPGDCHLSLQDFSFNTDATFQNAIAEGVDPYLVCPCGCSCARCVPRGLVHAFGNDLHRPEPVIEQVKHTRGTVRAKTRARAKVERAFTNDRYIAGRAKAVAKKDRLKGRERPEQVETDRVIDGPSFYLNLGLDL
jgi:hypothetical protein